MSAKLCLVVADISYVAAEARRANGAAIAGAAVADGVVVGCSVTTGCTGVAAADTVIAKEGAEGTGQVLSGKESRL